MNGDISRAGGWGSLARSCTQPWPLRNATPTQPRSGSSLGNHSPAYWLAAWPPRSWLASVNRFSGWA